MVLREHTERSQDIGSSESCKRGCVKGAQICLSNTVNLKTTLTSVSKIRVIGSVVGWFDFNTRDCGFKSL